MAHIIDNLKGFKVIAMTRQEAVTVCNFGISGHIICDDCNKELVAQEEFYYVPVLNRILCKECYKDWINSPTTTYFNEDKPYETRYFDYYKSLLSKQNCWSEKA